MNRHGLKKQTYKKMQRTKLMNALETAIAAAQSCRGYTASAAFESTVTNKN